jgi:hypothetical protein
MNPERQRNRAQDMQVTESDGTRSAVIGVLLVGLSLGGAALLLPAETLWFLVVLAALLAGLAEVGSG